MKVHVYDWRWADETTAELQAVAGGRFGRKLLRLGDRLSVRIGPGVQCAGCRVDGVWEACSAPVPEAKAKCSLCRSKEGNFVFTAFDGFDTSNVSDADLEKIAGPHVVYLAMFDRGLVKIGVSGAARKELRQIEQGSHATLYIAQTPDGVVARQIESLVRKSGLRDKVMLRQKEQCLFTGITEVEAKTILEAILENAKAALADHSHLLEYISQTPELRLWDELHGLRQMNGPHPILIPIKPGEVLSGTVEAMKGAHLVLNVDGVRYALCMKKLAGRPVDFTPRPDGVQLAEPPQHTLL